MLWRLTEACLHGQQIPDAAVLSGSPAQQADPRFHSRPFHVGEVHLVFKLQPDPASSPGKQVGSDMVVKVDPGHLCSRIQDLQQVVVSVIVSSCNMRDNIALTNFRKVFTVRNSRLLERWASLVSGDLLASSDCTGYREWLPDLEQMPC